jgi:hypothetical protein
MRVLRLAGSGSDLDTVDQANTAINPTMTNKSTSSDMKTRKPRYGNPSPSLPKVSRKAPLRTPEVVAFSCQRLAVRKLACCSEATNYSSGISLTSMASPSCDVATGDISRNAGICF